MSYDVKIVLERIPEIFTIVKSAVMEAELHTAQELAQAMREKITSGSKSGEVYGGHQASAPGEAPADWHHGLLESIGSVPISGGGASAFAGGESAPYEAEDLEYGSPGGKIAARPLVTPTAEEFKPIFVANISQAVKDAVK